MIRQVIREYWEKPLPATISRNISLNAKNDLINDITGMRRSGKTFLMFEKIGKLPKQATIYVNFENRKLLPIKSSYLNDIIDFINEEKLLEKYKRIYLFLDEIQKIDGWEQFVRSIYDEYKGKIKIFVSGSSANLLSKDYGELLTGRHLTTNVYPLSFTEFLRFKDCKPEKSTQAKALLREYLLYGGFPEVVLAKEKEQILGQLFSDVLSRDILSRADIRREQILEEFAYFLISNISNRLSFNKMSRYFKSRGIKISVQTLENYFYFMKNAFLLFDALMFSLKVKDQLQYSRKIYCIDTGLANLIGFKLNENMGKLYENTVAVELLRRKKLNTKVFYWHDQQQREVDFVVKQGLKVEQLIQVCYDLSNEDTKKRELAGLLKAMDEFELNEGTIITKDYESIEVIGEKKVKYVPLWAWLLEKY